MRSWHLQGKNEGGNWETLKVHEADQSLPKHQFGVAHWEVEAATGYRHFRILQTGTNNSNAVYNNYHRLVVADLGQEALHLRGDPQPLRLWLSFLTASRKRMDLKYSLSELHEHEHERAIGVPLTRNKQAFAGLGPRFACCGLTDPRLPVRAVSTRFYDPHDLSEELQGAQCGVLKTSGPRPFGRPGPPQCPEHKNFGALRCARGDVHHLGRSTTKYCNIGRMYTLNVHCSYNTEPI
jgi:hypothetical protein